MLSGAPQIHMKMSLLLNYARGMDITLPTPSPRTKNDTTEQIRHREKHNTNELS